MSNVCELFSLIPRKKIDGIFKNSETARVELDYGFLGFEDVYKCVNTFVPKDKIIVDLGCAYAFQSWYFRGHKAYIGVDVSVNYKDVLETDNSKFYFTSIQDFIINIFPGLGYDKEQVFAICSYVPDEDARKMCREFFPYCLVYYPAKGECRK